MKQKSNFFRYRIAEVWGNIPFKLNQVLIEFSDQGDSFKRLHYESRESWRMYCAGGFVAVRVKKEQAKP